LRRISFDAVAQVFDRTRGLPKGVMKQLLEVLTEELLKYKTILDAGTGTGRFAKPLQDKGFEVVGIDISKKMISVAKDKGTINLLRGDVCFLPFRNRYFDAALCNAILHLIPELNAALKEISRVTSKVLVSTIHEDRNPLRDAYNCLLESHGYESPRRGKPEHQLKSLVAPLRSIHIASYHIDVDQTLAHMSERAYSHQWDIPENTNKKVMSELRRQFAGQKFTQRLGLLIWNMDDIRAYCERAID